MKKFLIISIFLGVLILGFGLIISLDVERSKNSLEAFELEKIYKKHKYKLIFLSIIRVNYTII